MSASRRRGWLSGALALAAQAVITQTVIAQTVRQTVTRPGALEDPRAGAQEVQARPSAWPADNAPIGELTPLDRAASIAFRQWFVAIVEDQVLRRPSPRWQHRDCAGLVRFAVAESLRAHDAEWQRVMGWDNHRPRPPDVALDAAQQARFRRWLLPDGRQAAYAPAIAIVQNNSRFIDKVRTQAEPGDLLFFDQGDDQHLMVWTGRRVAYHTGADPDPEGRDNGLRQTRWEQLLQHPDTRWRPTAQNPNFAGLYRLAFLTP